LAEQEQTLGHLGQAVGRLKELGRDMNTELADQNAMLTDLDTGEPILAYLCRCLCI